MGWTSVVTAGAVVPLCAGLAGCTQPPNWCDDPAPITTGTPTAVDSTIRQPDTARALDIVFIGDGFDTGGLDAYRGHVRDLIGEIFAASALLSEYRDQINFHRVDAVGHHGTCLDPDTDRLSGPSETARHTAMRAVPDADVVVIIAAWDGGRANAVIGFGPGVRTVRMALHANAAVLAHELGHAAFGLEDEYTEHAEAVPLPFEYSSSGDVLTSPNVTTDPQGAKWRGLVDGTRPGGAGYARGVYHPTDACRMLRSRGEHDFCAVCAARVRHVFAALADPTAASGPPTCELLFERSPVTALAGTVRVNARAVHLPTARVDLFELDGAPLYDPTRDTQPPVAEHFAGNVIDTALLTTGWHVVTARCSGATGATTSVRVPFAVSP